MNQHLEDLAGAIRRSGLVLSYSQHGAELAFQSEQTPADLRRQIARHRRGLAWLMLQGDVRLCPVADHKREWYYAGQGRYSCLLCQKLDCAQLGMWKVG